MDNLCHLCHVEDSVCGLQIRIQSFGAMDHPKGGSLKYSSTLNLCFECGEYVKKWVERFLMQRQEQQTARECADVIMDVLKPGKGLGRGECSPDA